MNGTGLAAVGVGAALGAWSRWGLGIALNALWPQIPLGTLAANLIGGYLIGIALGAFTQFQTLSPELRLFVITGFLGGLTTFSTFSAEMATLLGRQQYGWALAGIGLHVAGSLLMTALGLLTMQLLRG